MRGCVAMNSRPHFISAPSRLLVQVILPRQDVYTPLARFQAASPANRLGVLEDRAHHRFGTRRSEVQILSPRPLFPLTYEMADAPNPTHLVLD
jgi:hypothetical protein